MMNKIINQLMINNHSQKQQSSIKQRFQLGLPENKRNKPWLHQFMRRDAIVQQERSLFHKISILKVTMLIILAIITFFLFQVSFITNGYEASIEKIMSQDHQNTLLTDQIANQFIDVKSSIQKDKDETTQNFNLFLSTTTKLQSKLSVLQPKLKSLELQTNVLEVNELSKKQHKKKDQLMNMMNMREDINILDKKGLNSNKQQKKKSSKMEQFVGQDYQFQIPKNIWIYKQAPKNYLQSLYLKNIAYYGNLSEYRIHYVNSNSIQNYFDTKVEKRLTSILELVSLRAPGGKTNSIYRKIILLHFLHIYGGVIVDGPFALTEDLHWLKKIVQNKFCSRGNRMIKPEMVGFFNPKDAQLKEYFQIIPFKGMEQINKQTYQFPIFQEYFIASIKKSRFLSDVLLKLYEMFDKDIVNLMKDSYVIKSYRTQEAYSLAFFIASKIVLKEKQQQLDLATIDGYKHFAYDHYGLNFINCFYGPLKMQMIYEDFYFLIQLNPQLSRHRIYHDMARYSLEQWNTLVGNTKYMFSLTLENSMNKYLEATSAGRDIQIHEGSFLHKLFYPQDKHFFIVKNPEKPFTNETNPLWESLPKYIWVFWYTGIKSAPIFTQACYKNLKQSAQDSGFELRQVNDQNLHKYLGQQILARIDNSVNGAKIEPHLQTKSNFYRLALLYYHGGIYLDATTLSLQNFDWVLKIGRFPSQYIVNRFEALPKVLMMWHPYFGQPEEWRFHNLDKQKNVKQQWHQSLQNGLLIAQKGSEFIGDWLEGMFQVHSKPYMQVQRIYTASGISKYKSTYQEFHYLIAMDTGKYVIGKKQKQLQKMESKQWINAPHYYHIWTFSGYLNPMKLWVKSNYQNPGGQTNDLIFKYPLSYVEEIIGKTRFVSKFFGYETSGINQFIMKNYGNFSRLVHSQSIFMKHIWRDDFKIQRCLEGFQLSNKDDTNNK